MTATPPRADPDLRALIRRAIVWPSEFVARLDDESFPAWAARAVEVAVLPEHQRIVRRETLQTLLDRSDSFSLTMDGQTAAQWLPRLIGDDDKAAEVLDRLAAAGRRGGCGAPVPAEHAPAVPEEADGQRATEGPYRVGRKVGRTIYRMAGNEPSDADELIGVLDSPALAAFAVRGMNAETGTEADRDRLAAQVAHYQRVVDAAKAWRDARPGPWVSGADVEFHLFAAVDALPDAGTDQTGDKPKPCTFLEHGGCSGSCHGRECIATAPEGADERNGHG